MPKIKFNHSLKLNKLFKGSAIEWEITKTELGIQISKLEKSVKEVYDDAHENDKS